VRENTTTKIIAHLSSVHSMIRYNMFVLLIRGRQVQEMRILLSWILSSKDLLLL